jgi:hypothetical protein
MAKTVREILGDIYDAWRAQNLVDGNLVFRTISVM